MPLDLLPAAAADGCWLVQKWQYRSGLLLMADAADLLLGLRVVMLLLLLKCCCCCSAPAQAAAECSAHVLSTVLLPLVLLAAAAMADFFARPSLPVWGSIILTLPLGVSVLHRSPLHRSGRPSTPTSVAFYALLRGSSSVVLLSNTPTPPPAVPVYHK
jgi:hypothetical protein